MEYVFSSMYQLSSYLFHKKISQQNSNEELSPEGDFGDYLNSMQEELNTYDRFKKARVKENIEFMSTTNESEKIMINTKNVINENNMALECELVKCYQSVPFVYFEEPFTLNFSTFSEEGSDIKHNNV